MLVTCLKFISGSLIPYSKRAGEMISFNIKMTIFGIILIKKHLNNMHQRAPNCTIFKNFLGGTSPRTRKYGTKRSTFPYF